MLGLVGNTQPDFAVTYTYAGRAESPDGKADMIDVTGPEDFKCRLFVDAADTSAADAHLPGRGAADDHAHDVRGRRWRRARPRRSTVHQVKARAIAGAARRWCTLPVPQSPNRLASLPPEGARGDREAADGCGGHATEDDRVPASSSRITAKSTACRCRIRSRAAPGAKTTEEWDSHQLQGEPGVQGRPLQGGTMRKTALVCLCTCSVRPASARPQHRRRHAMRRCASALSTRRARSS